MTIHFNCAICGRQLRVADKYAGRKGTCPNCGSKTRIPMQSEPELDALSLDEAEAISEPEEEAAPATLPPAPRQYVDDHQPDAPMTRKMADIDHEDLIDMTAMVDIVFFLLIYFLVTSFQSLSSTLPMPAPQTNEGAPQATAEPDADDAIEVRIDKDDVIWVENLRIEGQVELAGKLRDLHESVAHPDKVQIIASGDGSHGSAVLVMDSAKHAGLEKISITIDDELASN